MNGRGSKSSKGSQEDVVATKQGVRESRSPDGLQVCGFTALMGKPQGETGLGQNVILLHKAPAAQLPFPGVCGPPGQQLPGMSFTDPFVPCWLGSLFHHDCNQDPRPLPRLPVSLKMHPGAAQQGQHFAV